jgi:hypothetical protein
VRFESPAQPRPAAFASIEITEFAPHATTATVLPKIVIAVLALIDSSESRMTTKAFENGDGIGKRMPGHTELMDIRYFCPVAGQRLARQRHGGASDVAELHRMSRGSLKN